MFVVRVEQCGGLAKHTGNAFFFSLNVRVPHGFILSHFWGMRRFWPSTLSNDLELGEALLVVAQGGRGAEVCVVVG